MSHPAQQATAPESRLHPAIDISHHQPHVDMPRVAAAGVRLVFSKLTEGATYTDPTGLPRVAQARVSGMLTGLYHFMGLDSSPEAQAGHFLSALGGDAAALPARILALDLEDLERRLWGPEAGARALAWLQLVEEATGVAPWVYVSPGFARRVRLDRHPLLGAYPLWVADWRGREEPEVPEPWSEWKMWQTGLGRVDGVVGEVDVNKVWL